MKIVAVIAMLLGLVTAIRFDAKSLVGPAKPLKEVLRTGLAAVVLLSAAPSSSEVLEPLAGGIKTYDVVKKKEADSTVARPVAIVTDEQQRQLDSDVKAIIEKYSKPVTFGEFDDFKNEVNQRFDKVDQKLDGLYIFNVFMIYFFTAYSANEDRRLRREELEKKKNKNNWFWHSDE
mmetsp:Transcript_14630/g.19477  ORF Transcript_14630/g.19477 Transcript_14630/m.19477 type:complete len:176 (-) Transcript_14630:368-895(-)